MAAFQQEQKKVAELEGALSSQMKTMEIEKSKLRSANKVSLILFCIVYIHIYMTCLIVCNPYELYVITEVHVHTPQ